MRPIPPGVKVIALDAVGTLIDPDPPFWRVYLETASRHGITEPAAGRLQRDFRDAFEQEERRDLDAGWRTSEQREMDRWRRIVSSCFRDAPDVEGCFTELFAHFGRPDAWRTVDGVAEVLGGLGALGYRLMIASNFDSRLRSVADGLPELAPIDRLVISSEVGHRKPGGRFFEAVCRAAGTPPGEILFVGDDLVNDYHGSIAAGLHAILLDPDGVADRDPRVTRRISRLSNLLHAGP